MTNLNCKTFQMRLEVPSVTKQATRRLQGPLRTTGPLWKGLEITFTMGHTQVNGVLSHIGLHLPNKHNMFISQTTNKILLFQQHFFEFFILPARAGISHYFLHLFLRPPF